MKKTLRVFGIIAVVICLIFSIVACDNNRGKDSIDVVAISASEYASVEDALKGYVKEELAYSTINYKDEVEEVVKADYVSNESKGEVAGDKIKLSDEQKTNFVSAEKYAVKAKVTMASVDEDPSETTQTVYVLKYGEKFKFMVSTPEVGERVTNSYVKMLTDASKYENCTVTGVGMGKEEDDEEPIFDSATEFKFTKDATCQIKYYDKTRFDNHTPGGDDESNDRVMYVVKNGDSIAGVNNKINEEDKEVWEATALDGNYYKDIKTVADYNKYMFENNVFYMFEYLPAALFTKTETGFEFKYEEVEEDGDKETAEYKITVSDNKITGMNIVEKYIWTVEEVTYVESFESDSKISNFGSTSVSVPEVVTEALKQLA